MQSLQSPARLRDYSDKNIENTAPRTADSLSQSFYSPISPLDKLSTSNQRLSNMKRLSSPNLWRIRDSQRDSQPLRTVENSTSPFLTTTSVDLAEGEKKFVERALINAPKTLSKEPIPTVQTMKVEQEAKPVVKRPVDIVHQPGKGKVSTHPIPSYMRFTEAYKRSKGLLSADEERNLPHHHRDNNANKKSERSNNARNRVTTKALLGPKTAGVNKGTVPQPFHFHSSLRSTVIQEIKDNEKSTDEPFISLASRIKQFEENIAGRGYEHSLKDKDCKPASEDIGAVKHFIPRSPKLLTKIRHEQGHHHAHESSNDHQSERQLSQAASAKSIGSHISSKTSRSSVKPDARPQKLLTTRASRNPASDIKTELHKAASNDKGHMQDYERPTTSSLNHLKRKRDVEITDEHNKRQRAVSEASKKKANSRFTPTIPQPFSFRTDLRGQHYQEQFVEKLEMWRHRDQGSHDIHAKPAPHYPPPMAIKRSVKPLTATQDLVLHSEIRALERKTSEDDKKLKAKLDAISQEGRARRLHQTSIKNQPPLREPRRA